MFTPPALAVPRSRRYMDFHGNSVHQVGFGNAAVVEAIKSQMDELPFCTRRYTCRPAVDLAKRLSELAPDPLSRVLFAPVSPPLPPNILHSCWAALSKIPALASRAGRHVGDRDGAEAGEVCDGSAQDHLDVGLVPWGVAGCDLDRRRAGASAGR